MTMRITKDQQIGGVPARDVRDILNKLHNRDRWWHEEHRFSQPWFEAELFWLSVKHKDWYKDRYDFHCWVNMRDASRREYFKHNPDCINQWDASRRAAAALIEILVAEGFIEPNPKIKEWYRLIGRGKELCRATLTKPVVRKDERGDPALAEAPIP